ncbi:MAG TPA: glycine cleavage system protein GcvH [Thermodesulfovibrio thiophilus]|uniref:glycine cleavage system protein GcvH n=1 Tax=Thermodesulfovibrio thiophilus TaxID=340095 RepID=UPI00040D320F|nr:glycine cleavage system protein GcvH [Thermodesulfovibrio thiophilus]HHW19952.1 glycine cleavage system protein GcvH [Thermodesulfovibrio thiophilus]HOA82863.1 glycine cleavage system protein GcvH [Thermodesulfovibrio thiophilus]HQA03441.1 glycine cleavage system protein GcvH [Thermodesulfovibrio thiophilus]HQD35921.1 glycine cleavage system protein GcvH [Thermodesulfovibrio thiophilus]
MSLENYKFHKEHSWVKLSSKSKKVKVGITDYAQESLGDIIYIELPEVETHVEVDTELAEIESTKTSSPVIAPVSGTIVEINEELIDHPEIINEDPYGKGWIAVIEMDNPEELEELMDYEEYESYLEEES